MTFRVVAVVAARPNDPDYAGGFLSRFGASRTARSDDGEAFESSPVPPLLLELRVQPLADTLIDAAKALVASVIFPEIEATAIFHVGNQDLTHESPVARWQSSVGGVMQCLG
jgi:hypothetical protein